MSSAILAVDQGTSGSKAVIFRQDGTIAARASVPTTTTHPHPGYSEQDPEELFQSVVRAVKTAWDQYQAVEPGGTIACCGLSVQRETFMVWDESGRPLHPAVVWHCKRSIAVCNDIRSRELEKEVHDSTGLILDPYFSGTKVVWLYRNVPQVKNAVDQGKAYFGTVDTWLLYKLTQKAVYATDYTNACRTLFFNINDLAWDRSLLRSFGLAQLNFPEVKSSSAMFGQSDFDGTFAQPAPITAMIGDSHASAFGQACFDEGATKVTLGTGSSVLMNTGTRRAESQNGMMSTICFSTSSQVWYALEGIIVSCGSTLSWLRDNLNLYRDYTELEPMAGALESNEGVYLLPAFAGLGAPHWKMGARGRITGLTFGSTRNHLARAALESVAFQVTDVIRAMQNDTGLTLPQLVADGGISKNRFVMQLCADLLGTRVVQRGIEEVSALGAAALAGLTGGVYSSLEEIAGLTGDPQVYCAGDDTAAAQKAYVGWQKAVKAL